MHERVFFAGYSHAAAKHVDSSIHDTSAASQVYKWKGWKKHNSSRPPLSGQQMGTLLDSQIEKTVTVYDKFQLPYEFFFDDDFRAAYKAKGVTARLKASCAKLLWSTARFWKLMRVKKLRPVVSQLVTGVEQWGFSTKPDVVCLDEHNKTVVLEVKWGYEGTYNHCTKVRMQEPFQTLSDCPFNQHMLQLYGTTVLYRANFPSRALATPLLLRFHTDAVDVHPLRLDLNDAPLCARYVQRMRSVASS